METNGYLLDADLLHGIWNNLRSGRNYVKGVHDSPTKRLVMASRADNYYSKETCYFEYVDKLEHGVCYIDSEDMYYAPIYPIIL